MHNSIFYYTFVKIYLVRMVVDNKLVHDYPSVPRITINWSLCYGPLIHLSPQVRIILIFIDTRLRSMDSEMGCLMRVLTNQWWVLHIGPLTLTS